MSYFETFKEEDADLWVAVQEWIMEGWGFSGGPADITPLMAATALEMEARTQDKCVEEKTSDPSFPIRLRQIAVNLAMEVVEQLRETSGIQYRRAFPEQMRDPSDEMGAVILAIQDNQIIGCLDARTYQGVDAAWPHGWMDTIAKHTNRFDQVDVDLLSAEMAAAMIEHYKPGNIVLAPPGATLNWDEVEQRIIEELHRIPGNALAEVHNIVCETLPKIRHVSEGTFEVVTG
jgi:hypothetical protein